MVVTDMKKRDVVTLSTIIERLMQFDETVFVKVAKMYTFGHFMCTLTDSLIPRGKSEDIFNCTRDFYYFLRYTSVSLRTRNYSSTTVQLQFHYNLTPIQLQLKLHCNYN